MPTWRMVAGSSTESLALDVALQCQVPADIVQRAAYLFKVSRFRAHAIHCLDGTSSPQNQYSSTDNYRNNVTPYPMYPPVQHY